MSKWDELSMAEKAEMMKVAVRNGITNLSDIRQRYNEFAEGGSKEEEEEVNTNSYSVGNLVNALYQNNPKEKYLGEPEHHYDFTQSEEWANTHGYYPDARGHRDDRVKKPTHPSHPSRGVWDGDKFVLTDFGMQNPNYTLFGLNDGGQDPQATLIYNNSVVLPELTVTPNENYFFNPYDNIELHYAEGGNIYSGEEEETQQMEVSRSPHIDLAISNPWLYQKLHPAQRKVEKYEPTTFAGRLTQLAGASELGQKYADYTSSVIQQVPVVGLVPSALDLGYDTNRLYHNPSLTATKDVALDAASLVPALRKTMKGWWMKGNSGSFITETGQIINNPRVASTLEVILQPFRTAINTGVYGTRAADFLDDSKAYLKEMYNSSKIGKHFPIKALGGPLVEAAMNEYKKGGSIHISPSKKGTFTAAAKKHGKSVQAFASQVLAHPENYSPAMRKKANFARNARKWKHGLGGNLFDGTTEDNQQMNIAIPDATYVTRTHIFHPISRKDYNWEEAALNRANQVYSNYEDAKDDTMPWHVTKMRNGLRWLKDNINEDIPSGVSNCTLTATEWVDPNNPIAHAKSIHTNPEKYGYTKVDSLDAVPGNLLIAMNPNDSTYHTMMISGFAGKDSIADFDGKKYNVRKGEPLLTYSRGGHDNSFLRRNIPISAYTPNSDGKIANFFYRYNYPREVFLPEVIVTGRNKKK